MRKIVIRLMHKLQEKGVKTVQIWIILAVLAVLLANCVTFAMFRAVVCSAGWTSGVLRRQNPDSVRAERANYLIAGTLNQAEAAFQFLEPYLTGDVIYVQFQSIGWDARATAQHIAEDVYPYQYDEVDIYAISVGDHVARYLDAYFDDCETTQVRIIAINPCPIIDCVRPQLRPYLKPLTPLFEVGCHALGWLSTAPIIPTAGGRYSLILLADQLWQTAWDQPPHSTSHTVGLICSRVSNKEHNDADDLLSNAAIREYFDTASGKIETVHINTAHGDTIGAGKDYLLAVRQIWQSAAYQDDIS